MFQDLQRFLPVCFLSVPFVWAHFASLKDANRQSDEKDTFLNYVNKLGNMQNLHESRDKTFSCLEQIEKYSKSSLRGMARLNLISSFQWYKGAFKLVSSEF